MLMYLIKSGQCNTGMNELEPTGEEKFEDVSGYIFVCDGIV